MKADTHHVSHHILPISVYVKTIIALIVLMAATVGLAYIPFPPTPIWSVVNNVAMLAIACAKATLVVLYFMNVKYSTRLAQLYAILGFVWVFLLLFTLADYWSRRFEPVPSWSADPGSALPRAPGAPMSGGAIENATNVRPRSR
jgi:cytochrome c oxidase subunit IV